jgi:hypothetical protein
MLANGVALHHDIVQPHIISVTIEIIWKLKFELLHHPAYSPDPVPSDYHIFGLVRDALCGC